MNLYLDSILFALIVLIYWVISEMFTIKSKEKRVAERNRVAAGKWASWPLSPTQKTVLRVLQVL